MPYKTSRARKNLQQAYAEIDIRLRAAKPKKVDVKLREYVVAASIFLAHAEIENFISDLFSSFTTGIQTNLQNGSKLPRNLQSHLFLEKANAKAIFGNFIASNSEKNLLKAFSQALNGPAGKIIDSAATMHPFTGRDVYTTLKYPSEENFIKLFYRIGVDNIFDQLSRHLKQDSITLLKSLGSLRTQLAHTGILPGISCDDVRKRLQDAERFVGAVDRTMYSVTTKSFGTHTWISHMC